MIAARPSSIDAVSTMPVVWAALLTGVMALALSVVPWSFIDTYNVLYHALEPRWGAAVSEAFRSGVEYRPLLTLLTKLTHQVFGLQLWFYKSLVVVQFAAILGLLVWLFRPVGTRRAVAACVAVGCVVGLHTSRVLFLFVPLNFYATGLLLLLVAAAAAFEPAARRGEWLWFPLTLIALLVLESGLIIVALAVVLWCVRAPGVSGRALAAAVAGTACYLALRTGLAGAAVPAVYVETGLGFSDPDPERLREIFGSAPWLLWLYNIAASMLTVLASEPRGGAFKFIASLLAGNTPPWRWLHVISSVATTALVVAALWRTGPRPLKDTYLIWTGLVLLVCGSALGFLYTRDRIGMTAGVGYSMLVYVAIGTTLERGHRSAWRRVAVTVAVGAIAAGWMVRVGEAYFQVRDKAVEHRLEWTARYETLRGDRVEDDLMRQLRAPALEMTQDEAATGPAWTHALFERRISPPEGP